MTPRPDQRSIDLFDDFTRGTMSRRDFTDRLAKPATDMAWGRTGQSFKRSLAE